MKHSRRILAVLVAFALCAAFTAWGSPVGNARAESTQAESAAAGKTIVVGVIAWSTGMDAESEFIGAVQTALSEKYADQIDTVFVADATMNADTPPMLLQQMIAMFEGGDLAVLIVNDEKGFDDEALLDFLKDAEAAGIIMGVDHAIDGAPENAFVYDASDAAGCAEILMENALR